MHRWSKKIIVSPSSYLYFDDNRMQVGGFAPVVTVLLFLPVGHPLLGRTRKKKGEGAEPLPVISIKHLTDEPFILVRRTGATGMYSKLIEACEKRGLHTQDRLRGRTHAD